MRRAPRRARLCGRRLVLLAGAVAVAVVPVRFASAQQFVVDDAGVVDAGACQLEAWHGESASWLLPACRFVSTLELTAGAGLVGNGDGGRDAEYVLQAKLLLRAYGPRRPGVGLVAGVGADPFTQASGRRLRAVYAYAPVSVALADAQSDERLLVHANAGWLWEYEDDERGGARHHRVAWGVRADLLLPWPEQRLALIGELFGEDRTRPEVQLGVRVTLVPERLRLDVSHGGHTERGRSGVGWAVGLAWTPPAF